MTPINAPTLSEAWLSAVEHLLNVPKGKDVNVVTTFPGAAEDPAVRSQLDAFLAALAARKPGNAVYEVDTVANTLFPDSWYLPDRADEPREHLYRMHARAMRVHRRISGEAELYFDRLVAYPSLTGAPVNQLETQVQRLLGQRRVRGPKSSAYEIGLTAPADELQHGGDLRVHIPGKDMKYMGFPCLSHVSLTLHAEAIHVTALYRNQGFVRKAYGNYVGLARLGRFIAREVGVRLGEITCIATHADAELRLADITPLTDLVNGCRAAIGTQAVREVDRVA
jgi:hypothetical protein